MLNLKTPEGAAGAAQDPPWGERGTAGAVIASELIFEDVTRAYANGRALDGMSMVAGRGEILALVGPSGCGKSTALRLAAGIERPTSGRILIDGREVSNAKSCVPPEKRGVGLMFQDYALFPHLNILDNVRFGLATMSEPSRSDTARRALARVGLAGYEKDFPHMLSGGEQQRVALARALAPRPGVLLMDEPFSNLDGRMRDEVREGAVAIIREIRGTAIIVTHDPEEALRVADRIVLMRAGRVAQAGGGEDLYLRPQSLFVARFFCEMNEIPGVVAGGLARSPLGAFPALSTPDGEAVLCLRPTGLILAPPGAEGPGATGRVRARRFLGDVDLYEVAVEGLAKPLVCRARASAPGSVDFSVGADVRVIVKPEDVLVFAASSA